MHLKVKSRLAKDLLLEADSNKGNMTFLVGNTHFPRESSRSQHECRLLARTVDLMVAELGLEVTGDLMVSEVLLRRL